MTRQPDFIERFRILELLGKGGMGVVYLAHDPKLCRQVAIKLLADFDNPHLRARFSREARAVAKLAHINIVTIFELGDHKGQPYIAMEYLRGETLADRIGRQPPLNLGRKLELMSKLCAGLGYAHREGIIHKDIKPANLFIAADGELKILDFGLARLTSEASVTISGPQHGTPHYMSPEQIRGDPIDHRCDIFACGLVLYELLASRRAYIGNPWTVPSTILDSPPPPLESLGLKFPPELIAIVNKAIEKLPTDRYQDLETMGSDLAGVRSRLASPSNRKDVPAIATAVSADALPGMASLELTAQDREPRHMVEAPRLAVDEARARARAISESVDEAQRALADGALDSSLAAVNEALRLDPSHALAREIEAQVLKAIELDLAQKVTEPTRTLDASDRDDALVTVLIAAEDPPEKSHGPERKRAEQNPTAHEPAEPVTPNDPAIAGKGGSAPPLWLGDTRPALESAGAADRSDSTVLLFREQAVNRAGAAEVGNRLIETTEARTPDARGESDARRRPRTRAVGWRGVSVGAALALLALGAGIYRARSRPASPPVTESVPAPSGTDVQSPLVGHESPGTLTINALPWAEVVTVVDDRGQSQDLKNPRYTPYFMTVPAGKYRVTVKSPTQVVREVAVDVPPGGSQSAFTEFAKVDADEYFRTQGWQETR